MSPGGMGPASGPLPAPADGSGWLARGEHELPSDLDWLTEREARGLRDLRFTKRRTEFLLRRWVGKQAVAAAVGWPANALHLARIEIANHSTGAPYVLMDGSPAGIGVSLSDRAGWAVCLVGADVSRFGCDLEIVEPRSEGFVRDFLTPAEQEYVRSHNDPAAAANLVWSAKESALKVLRTGLRRDTLSVEVLVHPAAEDGWGRLRVQAVEGAVFPGWWRREGTFLLTLAADHPFEPPPRLRRSAELSQAEPVHSWVARPISDGQQR